MKAAWILLFAASAAAFAAPAPVVFQSGPGRFEVVAADAAAARTVTSAADECWRTLAAPLELPAEFSSPVFVRLVPAEDWKDSAAFRVAVEPGGVVSARVRWSGDTTETILQRALVQSLLLRLAVTHHGVSEHLTAPLWLEQACVGWWRTRADGAQLDALKQKAAHENTPALADLLGWQRGGVEPLEWSDGAVWLLAFLQGESTAAAEWHALLARLLAGEEPIGAVTATFPGRFRNATERELWWATGWHHLSRARSLPALGPAESRRELEALSRFVFAIDGHDVVADLPQVLEHARDPAVAAELSRRLAALNRIVGALHPFYRNAGLSLAEALANRPDTARDRTARAAAFARDWRDATELETATTAALDALERSAAR